MSSSQWFDWAIFRTIGRNLIRSGSPKVKRRLSQANKGRRRSEFVCLVNGRRAMTENANNHLAPVTRKSVSYYFAYKPPIDNDANGKEFRIRLISIRVEHFRKSQFTFFFYQQNLRSYGVKSWNGRWTSRRERERISELWVFSFQFSIGVCEFGRQSWSVLRS